MKKYLINLVEEKGIRDEFRKYAESKSHFGFDFDIFLEFILAQTTEVQEQMRYRLIMIDFKNGDVMHFFKFLMDVIFKNYTGFMSNLEKTA